MAEEVIKWDEEISWDEQVPQDVLNQISSQKTATETLSAPKSFWQDITAPNPPESFDLGEAATRVGISTGVGLGLGMAIPPIGPWIGAASGAASGIMEEYMRMIGASDLARVGAGAVVGEIPALIGPIARGTANVVSPASLPAARGLRLFESNKIRDLAIKETQLKLFGKPSFDLNITPENSAKTQLELRNQYLGGVTSSMIAPDQKVSSVYRDNFYTKLKQNQDQVSIEVTTTPAKYDSLGMQISPPKQTIKKVPNVFANSPEYKEMLKDLSVLAQRERLSSTEYKKLVKIVTNESSLDPKIKETAQDDIINLIQNGGAYISSVRGGEPEIKKLIPDDAQKILRTRFNEYLERSLGADEYNILKQIERKEFIAEARDKIPRLLQGDFKAGRPEYDFILDSIKNSPEGKVDFANAVAQHLGKFDNAAKIQSEFNRIRLALKESGVLSTKQIDDIYAKIRTFDKTIDDRAKVEFIKSLIIAPLIGVSGAESSEPTQKFIYSL